LIYAPTQLKDASESQWLLLMYYIIVVPGHGKEFNMRKELVEGCEDISPKYPFKSRTLSKIK
jgi:hypothetical protein